MRFELRPHPDTPPDDPDTEIEVWVERWPDGRAEFSYHLHAATSGILLPERSRPFRQDELWKTTCFELFVRTGSGYREYNFAPSTAWAAFEFAGYRSGMRELEVQPAPEIGTDNLGDSFLLDAIIDLEDGGRMGLSAVLEEKSGTKSYWALAHPPGKPDFHHEACFAATLPPIEQP